MLGIRNLLWKAKFEQEKKPSRHVLGLSPSVYSTTQQQKRMSYSSYWAFYCLRICVLCACVHIFFSRKFEKMKGKSMGKSKENFQSYTFRGVAFFFSHSCFFNIRQLSALDVDLESSLEDGISPIKSLWPNF